jgi:hypothetical protein
MGKQRLTTPAGRPAAFGMRVRERIDTSMIINKLHRVVEGTEEMTMVQLQSAKILLNKTVPDLKAMEVTQTGDIDAKTVTNQQLIDVIEGQSKRIGNG